MSCHEVSGSRGERPYQSTRDGLPSRLAATLNTKDHW